VRRHPGRWDDVAIRYIFLADNVVWGYTAIVVAYPYMDADRRLVFTVERHAGKQFRIVDPDGSELPNPVPDNLALLYRLPELAAAEPYETIFVCEGEKDADAVTGLALLATTAPCGTHMGWQPRYTPWLRDRHVVILPDADGPGRNYARRVLAEVQGTARTAVIVDVHEKKRGPWDVSDWLNKSGDKDNLLRLVRKARFDLLDLPNADNPKKPHKVQMILQSGLDTTEKFLLFVIQEHFSWGAEGRLPTAGALAEMVSSHRVTVQKKLGGLRAAAVLATVDRMTKINWDILAAMGAQRRAADETRPLRAWAG